RAHERCRGLQCPVIVALPSSSSSPAGRRGGGEGEELHGTVRGPKSPATLVCPPNNRAKNTRLRFGCGEYHRPCSFCLPTAGRRKPAVKDTRSKERER